MWENRIWDGTTNASALKITLLNLRRSMIHQNKEVVMQNQKKKKKHLRLLGFVWIQLILLKTEN